MKIKNSKEKLIKLEIIKNGIKVMIKYPKKTRLKTRLKVLDKLKEELYK
jgi:hypothetical protein